MERAGRDAREGRRRRPARAGTCVPTMMLGLVLAGAAAVGLFPAGPVTAEEPVAPAKLADLEADFAASIADLVRRCRRVKTVNRLKSNSASCAALSRRACCALRAS